MPPNRQPELYAAAIIPYVAAAVALVLRMIARKTTRMPLLWEDYLAILAFIIGSGFTILSICKMRWGLGKHITDLAMPRDQIQHHYFLELWIDMWLYTFSVGLSKFVILGLYWRLFSKSLIRQPIRILFTLSGLWIIGRALLILLQCRPIRKFWTPSIPGTCPLTPMLSLFAAGIPHFVLEVAILLCPLIEIWRLRLATPKKIAVAAMFTSGFLVCASALGTVVHTVMLDRKDGGVVVVLRDLTWDGLDDQIWAVCDVNLASFATSLPLLRPIFRSFGGMFSGLKSTASPEASTTIHGMYPRTHSRTRRRKNGDSDSVVEFADEGGGSDKAYALRNVSPGESHVERQHELSVKSSMSVRVGKAGK